ncbi:unnamed protein product [Tilletia controversa]|uniref:2-amino-4-hydroxy-6-hydroxymethyldihydropteridine diphosphokinase n=2 Tax=Tilletia TaxID=13289 RepID=A0A177U5A9_9BASI|nr:hypothetical protein CF336_g6181 [Tilletia laevis]KAE8190765.1 hypothetical protein CF328_g5877 [Tilletia controversa]KAE8256543.1 hypothetical protein A4X03_0g5301 [Tilletia caries]KAE8193933.1 hypothetical protein CF335_g5468 [Tilletia laevis]CAD6887369.1 unnamed protein product [Tilletia caries]
MSLSTRDELPDTIHLADLQLPPQRFRYLNDLWDRTSDISPQPAIVTVAISTDLANTALTDGRDSLAGTVNYGTASKAILALASGSQAQKGWDGIEHLAEEIARVLINQQGAPALRLTLTLPKALLSCDGLDFVGEWHRSKATESDNDRPVCSAQQYIVRALKLNALIGLNPCEREHLQPISVTLRFDVTLGDSTGTNSQVSRASWNPRSLVKDLSTYIAKSTDYGTVEALSTAIAQLCFAENYLPTDDDSDQPRTPRIDRISVRVDKPSAVILASAAGAEVVRNRTFFHQRPHSLPIESFFSEYSTPVRTINGSAPGFQWYTAFLSLGSNLGVRSAAIHSALRLLNSARKAQGKTGHDRWAFKSDSSQADGDIPLCKMVDTSFMYETAPMYVEKQPRFLNAAVEITTRLPPLDLLDLTQAIEAYLGRDHAVSLAQPKGPRVVDLDMLWHDGVYEHLHENSSHPKAIYTSPRLNLPHIGLAEREFVLRPLADIQPGWRHPVDGRTTTQMLSAIKADPGMRRVLPIRNTASDTERTLAFRSRTYLMSIVNTTPDSFSDGGMYHNNVERTVSSAMEMLRDGADIVDIGGMSTAPGRPDVEEAEEANRVVPIVQGVRRAEAAQGAATQPPAIISVDTFRPSVAHAALDAGASLINDVTGARGTWSDEDDDNLRGDGTSSKNELGDEMLALVAERGVPIVLMHMRGTSRTMTNVVNTTYAGVEAAEAVVVAVREELRICVQRALRAGVPRWNIILDPGIGFAKSREGSLALVRRVGDITSPRVERVEVREHKDEDDDEGDALARFVPNLSLRNFPVLIGPSRKRFLAPTTAYTSAAAARTAHASANGASNGPATAPTAPVSPDPQDRVFSTAAACAAGVAGGCDFVRVHDTRAMLDVVRTADAIWRVGAPSTSPSASSLV